MPTGLTEFKRMLREFRGFSFWAVGAGTAVPFAAALTDVSPPWPAGIVLITAIVELVALVLVFSIFRRASKRRNNRALVIGAATLAFSGLLYLGALSLFTYETPVTNDRYIKGYECTEEARNLAGWQDSIRRPANPGGQEQRSPSEQPRDALTDFDPDRQCRNKRNRFFVAACICAHVITMREPRFPIRQSSLDDPPMHAVSWIVEYIDRCC